MTFLASTAQHSVIHHFVKYLGQFPFNRIVFLSSSHHGMYFWTLLKESFLSEVSTKIWQNDERGKTVSSMIVKCILSLSGFLLIKFQWFWKLYQCVPLKCGGRVSKSSVKTIVLFILMTNYTLNCKWLKISSKSTKYLENSSSFIFNVLDLNIKFPLMFSGDIQC